MSLVGFRAQNHPQQTGKDGARDHVDDRSTRPELFDPRNERFGFTLDVAAAPHNAKCEQFFTYDDDGILQPWNHLAPLRRARVWCNPPYSNIARWVEKAWEEYESNRAELIVMLLPANRTEQRWWQRMVEPHLRSRRGDFRVEFLPGRPRFDRPNWTPGPKGDRPPFGLCLLIWGDEDSRQPADRSRLPADTDTGR